MTDHNHTGLEVYGEHEPEYSLDPGDDGNKVKNELPGHYSIGVIIEGAKVPLARFPAGRLFKDIRLAKEASRQAQSSKSQQPKG